MNKSSGSSSSAAGSSASSASDTDTRRTHKASTAAAATAAATGEYSELSTTEIDEKSTHEPDHSHISPVDLEKGHASQQFEAWDVAIYVRNTRTTDGFAMMCATALTCSNIAHVELLISMPCEHENCPYRGKHHINDTKDSHGPHVENHCLMYGIRDLKDDHTVTCVIEPAFPAYNGSLFVGIRCNPTQKQKILEFCISQLGRPYNTFGKWWNFSLGMITFPYGTTVKDVAPCKVASRKNPKVKRKIPPKLNTITPRSWFCSEFVAAALIYADMFPPTRDPAYSQPKHIYRSAMNHPQKFPLTRADIQRISDEDLVKLMQQQSGQAGSGSGGVGQHSPAADALASRVN